MTTKPLTSEADKRCRPDVTIDSDGTATFDKETSISGAEGADLRATVIQVIPGR